MVGITLGHYQITSQLGKGGMGEIYQAKARKLGRDVAIKVLPEEFATDTDRIARFQREARVLASLNHPNIAAIYGLEEFGGTNFLVLELVEGETLVDRIKAGPIAVEEALKLALQITEALEVAHEKGVIHRDLMLKTKGPLDRSCMKWMIQETNLFSIPDIIPSNRRLPALWQGE
jgi:serine/threonine protein kinase